jgi:hypothetical protein
MTKPKASKKRKKKWQPVQIPVTVSGWIDEYDDDFGFLPMVKTEQLTTKPGDWDRVEQYARRVEQGQPLFSKGDVVLSAEKMFGGVNIGHDCWASDPAPTVWKGTDLWGAEFSPCGKYRYRLWKHWAAKKPIVSFIGLNPSTADEMALDNTLRRLQSFAQSWGCGGFEMLNLFAYRSTDPAVLSTVDDPIGDANDRAIRLTVLKTSYTVCCWGNGGTELGRSAQVLWAISKTIPKASVFCFGLNKPIQASCHDGRMYPQPVHPLYLKKDTPLIPIPWKLVEVASAKRED